MGAVKNFVRGAKATPPFPIPPFPFFLPLSSSPLHVAFPSPSSSPLKSSKRVWGGLLVHPAGNTNTKQPAQRAYKYHNFWRDNFIDAPTPITEGTRPPRPPRNSRPCVYAKNYYLKLHIQSTNTKRFSPVAVDNVTIDFVFWPKILYTPQLNHKILLLTLCHSQNMVF